MYFTLDTVMLFVLITGGVAWFVGYLIGYHRGRCEGIERERKIAVKAEVGYHWINPKTGETRFCYGRQENSQAQETTHPKEQATSQAIQERVGDG